MKINQKKIGLVFTALFLVFLLAACSTANETPKATATVAATQAPSATPIAISPDDTSATPQPTYPPINLEGAVITESGLQYLELAPGNGRAPEQGDILTMNFIGSLPDGTEITNSKVSGRPVTLVYGMEEILPGWKEGLGMMKAGGKARLVLPPELAFGETGYGMVPPNTQIILEIELLSVEKPPQPTAYSGKELTTTKSGLQYLDLVQGIGVEAQNDYTVTTQYTVWVKGEDSDQYIFSSKYGDPISFVIGRGDAVFPGWEEGVTNMKVGGKRLLVIPPALAFGDQQMGNIPANSTLIMEIELVEHSMRKDRGVKHRMTAVHHVIIEGQDHERRIGDNAVQDAGVHRVEVSCVGMNRLAQTGNGQIRR